MKTQRTFVAWLASSLVGAVALVGVGTGFASTSVITSAAAVNQESSFGSAGSLQADIPCPPAGVEL
jgi:ribose 5-phosphate isomerase